ncbi:uncharacterized protein LOC128236920 isoform X1 [Mya arenaria]|uniref:uncharacterized protein LOC128236920 isoform X1 n=2 Tax=Mya arenaria TaxID=6604 RepID=UPI0022E9566F|nr:uncharacterized protein LOC128236920 isoform X1 [Mya arenaria]
MARDLNQFITDQRKSEIRYLSATKSLLEKYEGLDEESELGAVFNLSNYNIVRDRDGTFASHDMSIGKHSMSQRNPADKPEDKSSGRKKTASPGLVYTDEEFDTTFNLLNDVSTELIASFLEEGGQGEPSDAETLNSSDSYETVDSEEAETEGSLGVDVQRDRPGHGNYVNVGSDGEDSVDGDYGDGGVTAGSTVGQASMSMRGPNLDLSDYEDESSSGRGELHEPAPQCTDQYKNFKPEDMQQIPSEINNNMHYADEISGNLHYGQSPMKRSSRVERGGEEKAEQLKSPKTINEIFNSLKTNDNLSTRRTDFDVRKPQSTNRLSLHSGFSDKRTKIEKVREKQAKRISTHFTPFSGLSDKDKLFRGNPVFQSPKEHSTYTSQEVQPVGHKTGYSSKKSDATYTLQKNNEKVFMSSGQIFQSHSNAGTSKNETHFSSPGHNIPSQFNAPTNQPPVGHFSSPRGQKLQHSSANDLSPSVRKKLVIHTCYENARDSPGNPRHNRCESRDSHINSKETDCEQRDSHVKLREGNFEPRDSHVKPREGHFEPRDSHVKPRNSNGEPRDSHCKPSDSNCEPRNIDYKPRDVHGKLVNKEHNTPFHLKQAREQFVPHFNEPKAQSSDIEGFNERETALNTALESTSKSFDASHKNESSGKLTIRNLKQFDKVMSEHSLLMNVSLNTSQKTEQSFEEESVDRVEKWLFGISDPDSVHYKKLNNTTMNESVSFQLPNSANISKEQISDMRSLKINTANEGNQERFRLSDDRHAQEQTSQGTMLVSCPPQQSRNPDKHFHGEKQDQGVDGQTGLVSKLNRSVHDQTIVQRYTQKVLTKSNRPKKSTPNSTGKERKGVSPKQKEFVSPKQMAGNYNQNCVQRNVFSPKNQYPESRQLVDFDVWAKSGHKASPYKMDLKARESFESCKSFDINEQYGQDEDVPSNSADDLQNVSLKYVDDIQDESGNTYNLVSVENGGRIRLKIKRNSKNVSPKTRLNEQQVAEMMMNTEHDSRPNVQRKDRETGKAKRHLSGNTSREYEYIDHSGRLVNDKVVPTPPKARKLSQGSRHVENLTSGQFKEKYQNDRRYSLDIFMKQTGRNSSYNADNQKIGPAFGDVSVRQHDPNVNFNVGDRVRPVASVEQRKIEPKENRWQQFSPSNFPNNANVSKEHVYSPSNIRNNAGFENRQRHHNMMSERQSSQQDLMSPTIHRHRHNEKEDFSPSTSFSKLKLNTPGSMARNLNRQRQNVDKDEYIIEDSFAHPLGGYDVPQHRYDHPQDGFESLVQNRSGQNLDTQVEANASASTHVYMADSAYETVNPPDNRRMSISSGYTDDTVRQRIDNERRVSGVFIQPEGSVSVVRQIDTLRQNRNARISQGDTERRNSQGRRESMESQFYNRGRKKSPGFVSIDSVSDISDQFRVQRQEGRVINQPSRNEQVCVMGTDRIEGHRASTNLPNNQHKIIRKDLFCAKGETIQIPSTSRLGQVAHDFKVPVSPPVMTGNVIKKGNKENEALNNRKSQKLCFTKPQPLSNSDQLRRHLMYNAGARPKDTYAQSTPIKPGSKLAMDVSMSTIMGFDEHHNETEHNEEVVLI